MQYIWETYFLKSEKNEGLPDTKEVLRQKMDIRMPLKVAKCGTGLHFKIPHRTVKMYNLEPGDVVHMQMKFVLYSNVREIPKI